MRKHGRDPRGRLILRCCRYHRRFTVLAGTPFAGYRFPLDVIALAVRWYRRFPLSDAGVAELPAERHAGRSLAVFDRVRQFAPLYEDATHSCRRILGSTWSVDESFAKVARCQSKSIALTTSTAGGRSSMRTRCGSGGRR